MYVKTMSFQNVGQWVGRKSIASRKFNRIAKMKILTGLRELVQLSKFNGFVRLVIPMHI